MRGIRKQAFLCTVAALLASASIAAEKGQIGIHLGTATTIQDERPFGVNRLEPRPSVGFSYQLSDRISLRPAFGFGHSSDSGWFFSLGTTALYHFRPKKAFSPYLGAGFIWHHHDPFPKSLLSLSGSSAPGFAPPPLGSRRYASFRAVGGIEYTLSRRLAVFSEIGLSQKTGEHYELTESGWKREGLKVTPVVGFTFNLR